MVWVYLSLIAAIALFFLGAAHLAVDSSSHRKIISDTLGVGEVGDGSRFGRMNRRFVSAGIGRWLDRQMEQAGLGYSRLGVFVVVVAATIIIPIVLGKLLAPAFGVIGLAAGYVILRLWLTRAREQRRERFVQQIPELARVLSSATNAGLSIATAWVVAESEMAEPARSEIARLNAAVRFGASLEDAMLALNDRLPAREVQVLMSTLVISSRSGGSLVKALRDISMTLDDRKEVRREVRTTLAQARATAYLVAGMSVLMLVVLNTISPGTVQKMTTELIGQIALVVGFGMIAISLWIIRRMTKVGY